MYIYTEPVRIGSPSCYQGVDKAEGTQVDIQSEEKSFLRLYDYIQSSPEIAGSRDPLGYMVQSVTVPPPL